jgi:alkylation response protein AidB-like acyl-CoA dehydrogenase
VGKARFSDRGQSPEFEEDTSMDFNFTPEEDVFREKVRTFLKINLPKGWGGAEFELPEELQGKQFYVQWHRKLYQNGMVGMSWPKQYGGQGATQVEQAILNEELARFRAPAPLGGIGLALAGPTLIVHGNEAQKTRYLQKILSGEEIWCQLFSEPNAGSDLAALRTRAELQGDTFIVNGQKIWTSGARSAHFGILLARTDPGAPKHKGISYLIVDMKSPGITIKPLRQITGESHFNEVFMDDLRVPRENLIGKLNDGWHVANTTLANERGTGALALLVRFGTQYQEIVDLARSIIRNGRPAIQDRTVRQRVAEFYIDLQRLKYTVYRGFSAIIKGGTPGPEGSIQKVVWSELSQRMQEFAVELQGPAAQLSFKSPRAIAGGYHQRMFLRSRADTIYAGTSEIQRNIIAQRVLGLPRTN